MSWAIRMHQALRFFPDEAAGYKYPMAGSGKQAHEPEPGISRLLAEAGYLHHGDCNDDDRR
mgnify:CR=1 FL=1